MGKICVYQGIEGAFSHIASLQVLSKMGESINANSFISARQFSEIFSSVCEGKAQIGLVPIENSLAGSIHENFDLLMRFPVWVCGEQFLRVEHQLLCLPSVNSLQELERVYSHPQALSQCDKFFEDNQQIEEVIYSDTARAALWVAQSKQEKWAAIASREAGERYGLKILQANIEDDPHNFTRFIVICSEEQTAPNSPSECNKASLALTLAHKPGSLAGLLTRLAEASCNLTKIESRPIHGRPFEYRFYLDLEFPKELDKKRVAAVAQEFSRELRVLGIYPKDMLQLEVIKDK